MLTQNNLMDTQQPHARVTPGHSVPTAYGTAESSDEHRLNQTYLRSFLLGLNRDGSVLDQAHVYCCSIGLVGFFIPQHDLVFDVGLQSAGILGGREEVTSFFIVRHLFIVHLWCGPISYI